MWMMGCSDNGGLNISDSPFNGRKLRPLIPRATTSSSSSSSITTTTNATHPCLNLIHTSDLFMLNHHLATVSEQSKRDFNAQTVVSSRWNPTPEQLQTLEELYRRGTRTPTADQIQQITVQLRRFGKIEGKNVFYWFQNHKARERQKRRRQAESTTEQQQQQQQQQQQREIENFENKELDFQVEQAKRWALPTNSSTLSEDAVSMQRAGRAVIAESRTDGWIQFEERELQQRRRSVESHATWQMMHINATTSAITTTIGRTTMNPMLTNTQNPIRESESQTLQLFPLRSEDVEEKEKELPISSKNNNCTPYQYFEFL